MRGKASHGHATLQAGRAAQRTTRWRVAAAERSKKLRATNIAKDRRPSPSALSWRTTNRLAHIHESRTQIIARVCW